MNESRFIVVSGGFTGDGSSEHRLYRNDDGDRVIVFLNQAAAEEYVLINCLGKHAMIAEVLVTAEPAIKLKYKNGREILSQKT